MCIWMWLSYIWLDPSFEAVRAQIDGDRMAQHVAVLASDEFKGRYPGTVGEMKTTQYLTQQFQKSGISPGIGTSYLQEVPLVGNLTRILAPIPCRGSLGSDRFQPTDEMLFSTTRDGEANWTGVPFFFAGYGVDSEDDGWDDFGSTDLEGALIVVRRNDPQTGDDRFMGQALSPHGLTQAKWESAARRGALGVIVIHEDEIAGYDWSVRAKGAGEVWYSLEKEVTKPQLALHGEISEDAWSRMLALSGHDWEALKAQSNKAAMDQALKLDLELDIRLSNQTSRIMSHNVIGLLRGSVRPEEVVIYTAHWDHVGVGDEVDGDGIFNGAVDNATGTAALLELARAFTALPVPPARSVLFIATTAEEQGLLGATYYTQHPYFPLSKTVGVINMDALFPFGTTTGMTVVALGSSELEILYEDAARLEGRTLQADSQPQLGAFYRSDHYPFAKRGVPAVFAVGGPAPDDPNLDQLMQRFQEYGANGYHKVGDEYDAETWDMAGIVQDVRMFFYVGYHLANSDQRPNWYWDSPFRKIRDGMLN